jgi:hypothetical protein
MHCIEPAYYVNANDSRSHLRYFAWVFPSETSYFRGGRPSRYFARLTADGGVAQLGERRVRNAKVGSSILLLSTIRTSGFALAGSRWPFAPHVSSASLLEGSTWHCQRRSAWAREPFLPSKSERRQAAESATSPMALSPRKRCLQRRLRRLPDTLFKGPATRCGRDARSPQLFCSRKNPFAQTSTTCAPIQ